MFRNNQSQEHNHHVGTVVVRVVALLVAVLASTTDAFYPAMINQQRTTNNRRLKKTATAPTSTTCLFQSSSPPRTPDEMFSSDMWPPIKAELDTLPVFCCANKDGQPLKYNVNGEIEMPFFYADVQAVETELEQAKKDMNSKKAADDLGIIPIPMGTAFEQMARNQAVIIPSVDSVENAYGGSDTNPLGLPLPVFGCLKILQETDGKPASVPLFMEYNEAKTAVKAALEASPSSKQEEYEILTFPLPQIVQMMATTGEESSFRFVPPKSSLEYIQQYLEDNS